MDNFSLISKTIFLSSCIIANSSWAGAMGDVVEAPHVFEWSVAGGANWIHSNSPQLVISSFEVDRLHPNNDQVASLWKVGLGYDALVPQLHDRQFFNRLLLELNVYYTSPKLKGDVWQYQLPQFNNYTYSASLSNIRLMLDAKPHVFAYHDVSLYGIFGIGAMFNNISYTEQISAAGVPPASNLVLKSQSQTNFGYDLGVGLRKKLTERFDVSLEYVYAYLGKVSPSGVQLQNTVALVNPPSFSLNSQGVLLAITGWF